MYTKKVEFSVFTKPWKQQSVDEIGRHISSLGFDGIEFPLRPGYQVEPQNAEKDLPKLAKQLGDYNLKIFSVASSTDEHIFAGCVEAGIPVIRIMVNTDLKAGYLASIGKVREKLDNIIYLCRKYNVKVGIQHHYGPGVSNSMELLHLISEYEPQYIGAIWDSAHSALAGEEPEQGLDIVWSHLCMVNLKNAFYYRVNGPEAERAIWKRYFTTGKQGLASWNRISDYLKSRNYEGVICLTAEYTDESRVNELIREDIAYAKSLFA
jgi:sugar phosphate isomerase/epimerase